MPQVFITQEHRDAYNPAVYFLRAANEADARLRTDNDKPRLRVHAASRRADVFTLFAAWLNRELCLHAAPGEIESVEFLDVESLRIVVKAWRLSVMDEHIRRGQDTNRRRDLSQPQPNPETLIWLLRFIGHTGRYGRSYNAPQLSADAAARVWRVRDLTAAEVKEAADRDSVDPRLG